MRRRLLRSLVRACLGAIALVVAVALTAGLARAGSHYTYCTMMGTIGAAPCCAHDSRDPSPRPEAPSPEVSPAQLDCCRGATVPSLPSAHASPPSAETPEAPLAAVLPSIAVIGAIGRVFDAPPVGRLHERPPQRRSRADARATLMVFLT